MMRWLIASVSSLVFVFAAGSTTTLAAQAAVRNHLDDKFQVLGALSWVTFTTKIRVDSDDGQGTEVDVEDELGASRTVAEPRLGFRWGISRRHSLEFAYQFARRGAERQITKSFEFQGETYDAGLFVKTKFNSDLAGLTWRWAFHASEKSRIGATLGLGAIFFRTGLDGYASLNDQTTPTVSTTRDLTAPVAALGGFGQWRLAEAWYLELDVRGLYVPVDRYEAFVGDFNSGIRWWPSSWAGFELGVGWNSVRIDISKEPEAILTGDFAGQIKYRLAQPRLAVLVAF